MSQHLVIIGGSGFLGLTWADVMSARYRVTLVQNNRKFEVPFAENIQRTLDSPVACDALIDQLAPDIIINCAAMTNIETCEVKPKAAHAANSELPMWLARASAKHRCKLIHISTDHLFDGTRSFWKIDDAPSALNVYGVSKADGEENVLREDPKALVIRTNFFGWGPVHKPSFSDFILNRLRMEQDVKLFEDAYFTPIYAPDLVNLVQDLSDKGAHGVFHVIGPERISKFEFGQRLAKVFDCDISRVKPSRLSERQDLTRRPLDLSLDDSGLGAELGHTAPSVEDALQRMREDEAGHTFKNIGRSMIPYGRHHLDQEDIDAVTRFLETRPLLTQGPIVQAFEKEIANRVGARYAVAVSSATAGLHIAAQATGLEPGKRMIVPPITFVASANAATYLGAQTIFCDIDASSCNLDTKHVAKVLQADADISTIMPVHVGGLPCDMQGLRTLADQHNCMIIEDAAHALGSSYECGAPVGSCKYSDMTVFSFHPVKAIALGEGGLITTNDETLYRTLLRLRSHGINKLDDSFEHPKESGPWYYEMQELGYNYRITDLQCALGLSQIKKLGAFVDRRRALAKQYDKMLAGWQHLRPAQSAASNHSAYHIYVLQIDFDALNTTRAQFMTDLKARGIGSQVHYVPVPMHPFYRKRGHSMDALPNARAYYQKALTIPLFYDLTDTEQNRVVEVLAQLTRNVGKEDALQ